MSRPFGLSALRGFGPRVVPWMIAGAGLYLAVCVVLGIGSPGLGIALAVGPAVLYLIVSRSAWRAMSIVVGGMVVLGTEEVGAAKIVYAGLIVLCSGVSVARLISNPPPWLIVFRPLVITGLLLVLLMAVGVLVSPNPASVGTLARQSIFYLLVPAAPLIGFDTGRDMRPRTAYMLIGVLGTVAAIGFATDWLNRRGVSNLQVSRFVLSSLLFAALTFSLAVVKTTMGRIPERVIWLIPVLIIPIALLVTGTRTNLIVLLALFGVLGLKRASRVPFGRVLLLLVVTIPIGVAVFPLIANAVLSDPQFIQQRLNALIGVVQSSPGTDQSFQFRAAQTQQASALIAESPVFGFGIGFDPGETLDTPLSGIVKFGYVGTAAAALFLITCVITTIRSGGRYHYSQAHTMVTGFALVVAAYVPFGSPLEDHGFGFAMILVFMAVASELSSRSTAAPMRGELSPRALDRVVRVG